MRVKAPGLPTVSAFPIRLPATTGPPEHARQQGQQTEAHRIIHPTPHRLECMMFPSILKARRAVRRLWPCTVPSRSARRASQAPNGLRPRDPNAKFDAPTSIRRGMRIDVSGRPLWE